MSENIFTVRRIVTGVDDEGKSIILSDEPTPHVTQMGESGLLALADIWRTNAAPSPAGAGDIVTRPPVLSPPPGGSVFRFLRLPPNLDFDPVRPHEMEAGDAFKDQDTSIHPGMHRTNTIDYAIVISGEVWAIMEKGETLMHAGDVLIQRATNHAWDNRSTSPCVIAFVLIDAA